jgi:hypothetical protein
MRSAGHRGRLPVKPPAERFPIRYLSGYLRTPLPVPVYPVDISGGITDWGMLGNGPDPTCVSHPQGVRDCTFAGRQHYRMAKATAGHETESWPTSDVVVAEYLAYTRGEDAGANIADLLMFWYKAGTILAFAPVDHTNPAEVDAAMAAFHGVYAGVDLTGDADSLFAHHQPWTTGAGQQPDPGEAHCIVKVAADGSGLDTWVTWGGTQRSTVAWTAACLREAWVIIAQEDADAANLDIATLRAEIDALHGAGGTGAAAGQQSVYTPPRFSRPGVASPASRATAHRSPPPAR